MPDQYQSREERRKKLQSKGKTKKQKKQKPAGLAKKILLILVILGVVGILAGVGTFAYLIKDTPKLDPKLLKDPISSKVLDKDGELIAEVGSENREYVNYKDIPKLVENAVLAVEDVRFYKHHGLDPIRLGGAVIANFRDGFGSEGASTITQQVIKNSFLTPEKTLKRKVQEAWLAYQLEQKYTKHQILEMYVNKVFVSENSHGLATAAKIYYDKSLNELTLPEAAQLAGMPQSPNNYNPFTYPELAEKRRNIVLTLMEQHGFISKQEMEEAKSVPVTATLVPEDQRNREEKPYDSFVDAVIDEVEEQGDFDIFADGLTIHTTLDQNAQDQVNKILNTNEVIAYPDDQFQAGIAVLDTKTGEIRAIGGGRNQQVKRGFNYAIDTKRQPGSTIKPILDYGPAIEYLKWGTYQTIDDKPIKYSTGQEFGNWDDKYLGPISMRTALQLSRNTPAVQALQQVGLDKAKDFAISLGIPLKEIYESYAIGGLGGDTVGVSPLQMAGAYSAFGNNGFYTKPHTVKQILLRDGTVIDTVPEPKIVMKDYTAFMVSDMLKSVLVSPGTGTAAKVPGLPIAGKTGTTNYTADELKKWNINSKSVPDAWFTGYTTNYSISVWTGYGERKTPIKPGKDQRIAMEIFKNLMAHISKDVETSDFTVPDSVQKVRIEKGSKPPALASEFTPDSEVITEYAIKGHAPKTVSEKYHKLAAPSNTQAQYDIAKNEITLTWDYNNPEDTGVQFEVTISDGAGQKQSTVAEKLVTFKNPNPGSKYTITIVAISGDKRSDPTSVTVDIPKPDNTDDEDDGNDEDGEDNGDVNPNTPSTPPDGGTGPGNGNGNGNGNSGT